MIKWLLKKLVVRLKSRTIVTDGKPYLTRWYLWPGAPRTGGDQVTPNSPFAIFIHFFHRGDGDRDQHNHPWENSVSLILTGGYREERGDEVRTLRPGMINVIGMDDFHRVDLLEPKKGCWTLFVAGKGVQDWGFRLQGSKKFVPWREYLGGENTVS